MAYNFLGLVNKVNDKFNEVHLTESNFASAIGWYADAKNAVNSALHTINFQEFEWPFNHNKPTLVLTENQIEYDYPVDTKKLALDTFRIKRNTTLNTDTKKLKVLDYEEYLEKYGDAEFAPEDYADVPEYVYRGRNLKFGLYPPPNGAYELVYEYYSLPPELEDWDDVPTVPESFQHVIYEGALYHSYMFRGALEEAAISEKKFKDLINDMTSVFMNRYEYVRSSVIRS